jgi:hypothetical protein
MSHRPGAFPDVALVALVALVGVVPAAAWDAPLGAAWAEVAFIMPAISWVVARDAFCICD